METEWDDIRVQIQKGYQRVEKANQRAERRLEDSEDRDEGNSLTATGARDALSEPLVPLTGFQKKLRALREG